MDANSRDNPFLVSLAFLAVESLPAPASVTSLGALAHHSGGWEWVAASPHCVI